MSYLSEKARTANSTNDEHIYPLSGLPRDKWRGSLSMFFKFTGTKPIQELTDELWEVIAATICPEHPLIETDKKNANYFVPCQLKVAPLVGNTLNMAQSAGKPTDGKMRSKAHVTEAHLLVMDLDGLIDEAFNAGLEKLKGDGLTYLAYTSFSHGNPQKPGVRARLVILVDGPLNVEEYSCAWHGVDQRYFDGQLAKLDPSGAKLYQQQGTWCCDLSRKELAQTWRNDAGVASANVLIAIGQSVLPKSDIQATQGHKLTQKNAVSGTSSSDYPASDANKIAESCQQIRTFKNRKGKGQAEPLWNDCLGLVVHCENGEDLCQDWSSGHEGYNQAHTARKLAHRMQFGPTTCAQFRKTYAEGCEGCVQSCKSPITLGWSKASVQKPVATVNDAIQKTVLQAPQKNEPPKKDKKSDTPKKIKDNQLPFEVVEPASEPVDPSKLLDELAKLIKIHIILDSEQADAVALWIALPWFVDSVEVLALLIINAPEKACGKSQLLDLVSRLVPRALSVANITPAALFRAIDQWEPTILIDEADTFIREKNELKGLINSGHTRSSAFVLRTTGDNHEPKQFSTWGAKALAGIALDRHLSDATMSRGIIINMRRKTPDETVSRLRHTDPRRFQDLSANLARFALDYQDQVKQARMELPEALSDRAQDNWEPLLAIAQCAGVQWLQRATASALKLSSTSDASVSIGAELLSDIQAIFADTGIDKITTADLIEALKVDDEAPWCGFNRGLPITSRQLAKHLKNYHIHSRTVRKANLTPKGYYLADFQDAFARYLTPSAESTLEPENLPHQRNVSPQATAPMASSVADKTQRNCQETQHASPLDSELPQPLSDLKNDDVTLIEPASPVQDYTSLDDIF